MAGEAPALQKQKRFITHEPDRPEAWRVSFRAVPRLDKRRRKHNAKPKPTPTVYSAWPLAERAEALLRAFNNPAPIARRLARFLRRAPKRAQLLLKLPDDIERALPRDNVAALIQGAGAALFAFDTG